MAAIVSNERGETVAAESGTVIFGDRGFFGVVSADEVAAIKAACPAGAKVRIRLRNADFAKVFWKLNGEITHAIPYTKAGRIRFHLQGKNG